MHFVNITGTVVSKKCEQLITERENAIELLKQIVVMYSDSALGVIVVL